MKASSRPLLPTLALGTTLWLALCATPAQAEPMVGTVIETMDSGGYTYAQVQLADKTIWSAGPQTALAPGAQVTIDDRMPMSDFHSKGMNRDFPMIYFVTSFTGKAEDVKPDAFAHCDTKDGAKDGAKSDAPLPTIAKAEGGQTIAEILTGKAALTDQVVSVRGQVTKYTSSIMGKNWLHLRDNSGEQDLVVTTQGAAGVGDVVLVTGKVAVDKDFGYGYRYPVLLEEASISKE